MLRDVRRHFAAAVAGTTGAVMVFHVDDRYHSGVAVVAITP